MMGRCVGFIMYQNYVSERVLPVLCVPYLLAVKGAVPQA